MTVKMTDYEQWAEAVSFYRYQLHNDNSIERHQIITHSGIVLVEVCFWANDDSFTRMEFVWHGLVWIRSWKRSWPPQTLSRLARVFVEDIANE